MSERQSIINNQVIDGEEMNQQEQEEQQYENQQQDEDQSQQQQLESNQSELRQKTQENPETQAEEKQNTVQSEQQQEQEGQEQEQELQEQQEQELNAEQEQQNNCQHCREVDEKIVEQELTKEKLQAQSQKLRTNIHDLKEIIETTIQKQKEEKKQSLKPEIDPREAELKKQLKHHNAIYLSYKSKLDQMQKQFNLVENKTVERSAEYKNEISTLNAQIMELENDNKIMKKVIKSNEGMIRELQPEQSVQDMKKRLQQLKEEHKNIKQDNLIAEKELLFKREYITRLEANLRDIMKGHGIVSENLQKKTSDNQINQKINLLAKNNYIKKRNIQKETEKKKLTKEEMEKMKHDYTEALNLQKRVQKRQENEMQEMQRRVKEGQYEKEVLARQLKEKEKEQAIIKHRHIGLQRYKKRNQLPPMEFKQTTFTTNVRRNVKVKDYIHNNNDGKHSQRNLNKVGSPVKRNNSNSQFNHPNRSQQQY